MYNGPCQPGHQAPTKKMTTRAISAPQTRHCRKRRSDRRSAALVPGGKTSRRYRVTPDRRAETTSETSRSPQIERYPRPCFGRPANAFWSAWSLTELMFKHLLNSVLRRRPGADAFPNELRTEPGEKLTASLHPRVPAPG